MRGEMQLVGMLGVAQRTFLPTTEDEAFFLVALPPDLTRLLVVWAGTVLRFCLSRAIGRRGKRLEFERCDCTAFCKEVAR